MKAIRFMATQLGNKKRGATMVYPAGRGVEKYYALMSVTLNWPIEQIQKRKKGQNTLV